MSTLIKKHHPNYKNIFDSLDILHELHKDHFVTIEKLNSPIDKILANFTKSNEKGFTIKFDDRSHNHFELGEIENVNIKSHKYTLCLDEIFINSIAPPTVTGSVSKFQTVGFNKKTNYFFRLIIPLNDKINFHYHIKHLSYETKKHLSAEFIRVEYDKLNIDLYQYNDKEHQTSYLILDTITKLTHEEFSDYCFSTLVAFGYVTGKLPQDQGYFFAYENIELSQPSHIYYTEFRDSMFSSYSPIYGNAFGYIRDKKIAKETHKKLRALTLKEFSALCKWAFSSIDFSSILLLIIEASTSSLLVMPSGFSVALEGLTDLIVKEKEEKVAPIKDKKLAGKIRSEFRSIIDSHSKSLDLEGQQILKSKIDNINQLTNRGKLTKPFELLKFKLTTEDIKAIEHRNDFLHGRIALGFNDEVKVANQEVYYISLRLYTLLAILILKSVGYDNRIVNYPKIHENVYKKKLSEEHFRQI